VSTVLLAFLLGTCQLGIPNFPTSELYKPELFGVFLMGNLRGPTPPMPPCHPPTPQKENRALIAGLIRG